MEIKIKKLNSEAKIPTKGREGDAAYDLYTCADQIVYAGERHIIKTGIALKLPHGYAASVRPRSGFSAKGIEGKDGNRYNADVLLGLIDETYTGEIGIIIKSSDNNAFTITKGTRLAQLLIEKVEDSSFVEVDELDKTERGDNGFGSSGTN